VPVTLCEALLPYSPRLGSTCANRKYILTAQTASSAISRLRRSLSSSLLAIFIAHYPLFVPQTKLAATRDGVIHERYLKDKTECDTCAWNMTARPIMCAATATMLFGRKGRVESISSFFACAGARRSHARHGASPADHQANVK
jgi:hypothetical protein